MQAEQSVEREPLPHWLEELEQQASSARLELEREQNADKVAELEALLADLPGIFERKFSQRLQPLLESQQLLMEENNRLRLQVERLLPAPGEVRLRFPQREEDDAYTSSEPDPESLPPLLRLIRGGRPDASPRPTAEWEDPRHR